LMSRNDSIFSLPVINRIISSEGYYPE